MGIIEKQLALQGTGSGVFFLSFLLLFFLIKDKEWRYKLLYPNLILLVLFMNPLMNQFIWTRILSFVAHRLVNCIPIGFIIAYVLSYFWNETKRKDTWVFGIGIVLLMFMCADNINGDFMKAENLYGIPQDTIEVSELVLEEKEIPLLLVSEPDANFFRQYSNNVHLLYGEDLTAGKMIGAKEIPKEYKLIADLMRESPINMDKVGEYAAAFSVDYIVINREEYLDVVNEDNQWFTEGRYIIFKRV